MFKELLIKLIKLFVRTKPDSLLVLDDRDFDLTIFTESEIKWSFIDEEYCLPKLIYIDDIQFFHLDLDKRYMAILRQMQLYIFHNICSVKSHAFCLTGTISLLFGLCCSQSFTIFRAFYGTSLIRIPSL